MGTLRELSRDEKLMVIDAILSMWKEHNVEEYICVAIVNVVFMHDLIRGDFFGLKRILGTELIPELMVFKPEGVSHRDRWFGIPLRYGGQRTQVLRDLRKMIAGDY